MSMSFIYRFREGPGDYRNFHIFLGYNMDCVVIFNKQNTYMSP